ncbi:hypothetical protein GWI33_023043 [Rhynchophorus ferrugineus]|uniref:Uncharacterized protein n=1 Tax=Rhynchophorus ferrugineus TaxID=354439 RepID=A0A834M1Y0_RHYFE|nr:hypothetical protein GWI33_023043 [Rhynchophorus ferrugineus]
MCRNRPISACFRGANFALRINQIGDADAFDVLSATLSDKARAIKAAIVIAVRVDWELFVFSRTKKSRFRVFHLGAAFTSEATISG